MAVAGIEVEPVSIFAQDGRHGLCIRLCTNIAGFELGVAMIFGNGEGEFHVCARLLPPNTSTSRKRSHMSSISVEKPPFRSKYS